MHVRIRAAAAALVLVTVGVFAFVMTAPRAAAASTTWTTDVDFNQMGSVYLNTELLGTGIPAKVELIKSTTDWANRNPSAPTPGNIEGTAMAYDPINGVTVLFGGYNGLFPNLYSNETWEYDWNLNTWTEDTGYPRPALRQSAAMSFDPAQQVMVLFGGYNDTDFLTDTWEYDVDAKTWSEITTSPSPPMLATATLVYHASASRHVMVGSDFGQNVVLWVYNAATNAWQQRSPSGTPPARSGFATAYHAGRDRTVLFGGSMFQTLYDDTFEYNYGAGAQGQWTLTTSSGPSARASHAMAYRSSDTSVILFGGLSGSGKTQDTWAYGRTGASWETISTSTLPPARNYHAMAYDSVNDVVIMYGGLNAAGTRLGDTWSLGAAYAAAGKYTSAIFNAGGASVNWDRIFWNKTAPLPHFLRFQTATANSVNGPWTYFGPGTDGVGPCTQSEYYWSPNIPICSNQDGAQYLRFLADFGSFDTQFTPSMEDVTITFTVPPADPCILYTDPSDITFNVPMWKNVTIGFSEAMDASSFWWRFDLPPPPNSYNISFEPSWDPTGSVVTLYHPNETFLENKAFRMFVSAKDLDGNPLSPNCPGGSPGAPNPFTFVTVKIFPYIVRTDPPDGGGPHNTSAPIIIDFSEPMDTTSLTATTNPTATFVQAWSNGDRTVSLTPSPPLLPCTVYEMTIGGKDTANNGLIPGQVPNPFSFYTDCKNPYLVATNPPHFGMDVALNAPIIIDFVEPMLTSSVTATVDPNNPIFSWSWSNGNRKLTGTHSQAFPMCTVYTVTVTGTDPDGNPLIPNPVNPNIKNPFKFMTLCDNPSIMVTIPEDGAVDVPTNQQIDVAFSDMMNEGSVTFRIGPGLQTNTPFWDASVFMHIPHIGMRQCTLYTVEILGGTSQTGFPLVPGFAANPWSFETVCTAPYITDTNPANDTFLVPLDAPVWVNFSEPMDTSNVVVQSPGVTFTRNWSNGDRTLRLDHAAPFTDCLLHQIFVDGVDLSGESLLTGAFTPGAPNPWEFTTICLVSFPYIIKTDPAHQEQNVPLDQSIVIDFSEAMNTTSFSANSSPSLGLDAVWSNGDKRVTLGHTTDFVECRTYTIQVFGQDLDGEPLGTVPGSKPNPWSFKTTCIAPQILLTNPGDEATDIPLDASIVVTFSETMSRPSISVTIVPNINLQRTYSDGDKVLTLTHTTPFQPLTRYCVTIGGKDLDGNDLVPGPVPNPFCFTTGSGLPPPSGLRVIRADPNITLQWNAVPNAVGYRVYTATNRFAAFPSGWASTDVTLTTHSYPHFNDGLTRYYIVRARDASNGLSANSTMGSKIPVTFFFSVARSNVNWVSLPYRSIYHQASDITDELGPTNIDVVAKWDAASQSSVLYFYFRGAWRGENFAIGPGDAIWLGVKSQFTWVLNGTDRDVSLSFTFFPPPNANLHWISLPHTSAYQRASDIVKAIEGGTGAGRNTKITEVAKWDGLTQQYVKYTYGGTGWGGNDFSIASSDAIYLKVVATFAWTPQLLTPEVP